MIYAADFTNGSKTRSATVTLYSIENGARQHLSTQPVADKREARAVAKRFGYKCWNF